MNAKELRLRLEPFKMHCELAGIHIEEFFIKEVFAGSDYYVDAYIPSLTEENYMSVYKRVCDILWHTTNEDTRGFLFNFWVTHEPNAEQKCFLEKNKKN